MRVTSPGRVRTAPQLASWDTRENQVRAVRAQSVVDKVARHGCTASLCRNVMKPLSGHTPPTHTHTHRAAVPFCTLSFRPESFVTTPLPQNALSAFHFFRFPLHKTLFFLDFFKCQHIHLANYKMKAHPAFFLSELPFRGLAYNPG